MPGDATVLKRVFCDNFVIFCRRSKKIAFLESVNFPTCVYMRIFNFRDDHVTTFRHHSVRVKGLLCRWPSITESEMYITAQGPSSPK